MSSSGAIARALRRMGRDRTPIWYHPAYRLPVTEFGAVGGIEPRRADFVAWYLLESAAVPAEDFHRPEAIAWSDLARVHSRRLLASLLDPAVLARVFAVDPSQIAVDAAIETLRLACGGTLAAARAALQRRGPALNLLGGFHHAA
ncbi:MAG TPA: hypothetical protein VL172_13490, partial [Kofleriaceae bacterium]|nr:hypothetical protein [Kofleriaceae bacterium]